MQAFPEKATPFLSSEYCAPRMPWVENNQPQGPPWWKERTRAWPRPVLYQVPLTLHPHAGGLGVSFQSIGLIGRMRKRGIQSRCLKVGSRNQDLDVSHFPGLCSCHLTLLGECKQLSGEHTGSRAEGRKWTSICSSMLDTDTHAAVAAKSGTKIRRLAAIRS